MDINEKSLIVGCNYHTTWQRYKGMRFVLIKINGTQATLKTRTTNRQFSTNVKDLIFIMTNYNINKANKIIHESRPIKSKLQ